MTSECWRPPETLISTTHIAAKNDEHNIGHGSKQGRKRIRFFCFSSICVWSKSCGEDPQWLLQNKTPPYKFASKQITPFHLLRYNHVAHQHCTNCLCTPPYVSATVAAWSWLSNLVYLSHTKPSSAVEVFYRTTWEAVPCLCGYKNTIYTILYPSDIWDIASFWQAINQGS